jgi:hypothetical protein
VTGWAIDAAAASGTGVDVVDVYAQPIAGGAESHLGRASYGEDRPPFQPPPLAPAPLWPAAELRSSLEEWAAAPLR